MPAIPNELLKISTGCAAFDGLLDGGFDEGLLFDIFGPAGSGKSQLCFTLCANCARKKEPVVFIDTSGTFRPERVTEIAGTANVLGDIQYYRAYSIQDQILALERVKNSNPRLVVIDSATALFSLIAPSARRHLALMSHLHELAYMASVSRCSIVITNMVRATIQPEKNAPESEKLLFADSAQSSSYSQHEFLGTTVSLYSHVTIELSIIDSTYSHYKATLQHPGEGGADFTIESRGIIDFQKY